jgi:hypothetical protein
MRVCRPVSEYVTQPSSSLHVLSVRHRCYMCGRVHRASMPHRFGSRIGHQWALTFLLRSARRSICRHHYWRATRDHFKHHGRWTLALQQEAKERPQGQVLFWWLAQPPTLPSKLCASTINKGIDTRARQLSTPEAR